MPDDEQAELSEAKSRGWYCRSRRTIRLLNAWREWCRENRRPAVVVILGTRDGKVEVDGETVWTGPRDEAEGQAYFVAASQTVNASQEMLFD